MINTITPNKLMTADRVTFNDGTELTDVTCFITDRFLILPEATDAYTIYNLDGIAELSNVKILKAEKAPTSPSNVWRI